MTHFGTDCSWNAASVSILQAARIGAAILILLCSGCGSLHNKMAILLGAEQNLIDISYEIAENLERQAFPPLVPRHPEQPILTTTFVNNNDLSQTSHFSRILQEHLTSRFVQMGYTVKEVKLRNELAIEPRSGEKMLSRNIMDIKPAQHAQAVAVGTYSMTSTSIYISARMIDPSNSSILSSVDYRIIMDANIQAMFGLTPQKHDSVIDPISEPKHSLMTRLLY
ncbi:MAG: FlgO family outer membrane protein [Desulfopila sp.]|jgi:hypothetical protein|nr:FlgO family outer membrane protein [Desulfopila sp.]